jgi:hypothetical protein
MAATVGAENIDREVLLPVGQGKPDTESAVCIDCHFLAMNFKP